MYSKTQGMPDIVSVRFTVLYLLRYVIFTIYIDIILFHQSQGMIYI